jgi:isoleucyl-tRNA synthetase
VPHELKSTLNLPKTAFAMKANLPANEPKVLARWEQMRIYDRIREARAGAPVYVLHDGPPYANGPLHLGHALNKCLKDFVVKSKTMAGFDAPYVPGWDCHGLPIEIKVDQQLGGKKLEMNPSDVRRECRRYAEKYLDLQREQFKRMGVFGRWDRPYSTMTPQYEAVVLATFYHFFENQFVYKGLRSVYWCIHDRTALAEAEVEYENHTSPTVWVKYRLTDDAGKLDPALAGKNVFAVIWTTTPWTLPASMAVAFHPRESYVALGAGEEVYLVARKLAPSFEKKLGLTDARELASFPGEKMEYANFAHPFLPRNILGVLADYVTMDQGTGIVHTAPAHGAEDFATGAKYKLDPTCDVDAGGHLRNGLPEYDGLKVFQANRPIIELLKRTGALVHEEALLHSYPHCWRCHNPIIFRATEQWFIAMETKLPGGTLRSRTLEEIKRVKWDPAWGEERIANMIATRPDWCISRQRIWGVPIAVFLCEGCGRPLEDPSLNRAVVDLFGRSGADAWYTSQADALLPEGTECPGCRGTRFKKESDILDVWFESGSSYLAARAREPQLPWPADLYLEGGDQYRGWFHSSLLCAMGVNQSSPYAMVATNGWTLDEQGRAMSKSLDNGVDPVDISSRLGAEIVRLWVASVDFREDVVCSENLMLRVAENYRKIRNTFRYILGNLSDFDPQTETLPFAELEPIDQYMLRQTSELAERTAQLYAEFAFHRVYQDVNYFCVSELSAFYFDVLKDRLYTSAPKSKARLAAQTAIWRIGETLVRLLAPVTSFTCEEVWQFLPPLKHRSESVQLEKFFDRREITGSTAGAAGGEYNQDWIALREVRDEVLKVLEQARAAKLIGGGLEAQITITASGPVYAVLQRHESFLRYLFIVSAVSLIKRVSQDGQRALEIEVGKAAGEKCERCWNYSTEVGKDATYPTICERCSAVLRTIEAVA